MYCAIHLFSKAGLDNRLFCALGTIKIRESGHQQNKEVIFFMVKLWLHGLQKH